MTGARESSRRIAARQSRQRRTVHARVSFWTLRAYLMDRDAQIDERLVELGCEGAKPVD